MTTKPSHSGLKLLAVCALGFMLFYGIGATWLRAAITSGSNTNSVSTESVSPSVLAARKFDGSSSANSASDAGQQSGKAADLQNLTNNPMFSAPLPDDSEAVVSNLEAMQRRANQGDARAACWLGLELTRCHDLNRMQPWQDDWMEQRLQSAEKEPVDPEFAARWAQDDSRWQRCRGLETEQMLGAGGWLLQAADAGSVAAIERLILTGPNAQTEFPDPEQFRMFQERRVDYLAHALRQGSAEAAMDMMALLDAEYGIYSEFSYQRRISDHDRRIASAFLAELQRALAQQRPELVDASGSAFAAIAEEARGQLSRGEWAQVRARVADDVARHWAQNLNRDSGATILDRDASEVCGRLSERPARSASLGQALLR